MKSFFIVLIASALLAGCGSAVKLDNVPVEDKAGASVSQVGTTGSGNQIANGGVVSVELDKSSGQVANVPAGSQVVYFDYDSFLINRSLSNMLVTSK
jgi:peptidoglycan-associated lipoprotein